MNDKKYTTVIEGNKVEILKKYRTRTQYEYFLTIYMGNSDIESILIYNHLHLTKKSAIKEANKAITSSKKPRIERVVF
jgi:hypothetical protein